MAAPIVVSNVKLVNRKDGWFERLKNAEIRAGMDEVPFGTTNKLLNINTACATYQGPPTNNQDIYLVCNSSIMAKFLTIQLKDKNAILQINELKITGNYF